MGNFWLKVKVWTKGIFALLVAIYALLFVYNNSADATVWWWFGRDFKSSTVILILIAFLAGAVGAVMVRTTFTTLRQVRELRSKSRTGRIERELADMKEKAARLQTKPASTVSTDPLTLPPSEPIE